MNSHAGPPLPPPLPGRESKARQRMLNLVLAALIAIFVLISAVLAVVILGLGFAKPPAPRPQNTFTAPEAAPLPAPVLHLQSRTFNLLRGENLFIAGSSAVVHHGGYLLVGDAANLQIQDAITVSAWFNARSYDQPMTVAGRAQNGPPWRYPFLSWLVRINTESLIEIDVGHAQNYTPSGWNVPPLQPGQWYFVAMTFDGQTKKLFLNESHITSINSGSPNSRPAIHYTPGRAILIGADESEVPVGDRFQGAIDDVRIYDRALLAEEVQRVFQEGARRLPLRR